jgi:hypothetical protein
VRLFATVFASKAEEDSDEGEVARAMSRAWIRFASDLNPNGPERTSMLLTWVIYWPLKLVLCLSSTVPSWPAYDSSTREMLQVHARNMTMIPDDFRAEAIKWMTHDKDWTYITGR